MREQFVVIHDFEGSVADIQKIIDRLKPLEEFSSKHEKDLQTKTSFSDLKDILDKYKLDLKSTGGNKVIQKDLIKPDGMVDTWILKEILDRVNDFDSETMNLKNKIIEVENTFKNVSEQLMLNKYDHSAGRVVERNVESIMELMS